MQIVIDINDELMEYFANYNSMNDDGWFSHSSQLLNAFRNGVPLPKGHGRLIDVDAVIAEATERMKYPTNYKYMECVIAHMNLAQTIIEADKAESEE